MWSPPNLSPNTAYLQDLCFVFVCLQIKHPLSLCQCVEPSPAPCTHATHSSNLFSESQRNSRSVPAPFANSRARLSEGAGLNGRCPRAEPPIQVGAIVTLINQNVRLHGQKPLLTVCLPDHITPQKYLLCNVVLCTVVRGHALQFQFCPV